MTMALRNGRVWLVIGMLLAVAGSPAGAGQAPSSEKSAASVPLVINYQGRFTDDAGNPLTGTVDLEFRLYAGPDGGATLWSELHLGVPLQDGVASVLLGSLVSFPELAFRASQRYLEVVVNGDVTSPRLVVTSVPFAVEADRLDGKNAGDFEAAGAASALAETLSVSDGSPPNEGADRVHWDNLVGVPEGFADGVDDAGGPAEPITGADVVDSTLTGADLAAGTLEGKHLEAGTVTSREIADGAIELQDLGFPVGDVTAVYVTGGLTGGGTEGDIVLSVGAGNGIQITGSSVSLAPSYFSGSAYDARFVSQSVPTWQAQAGAVAVAGAAFRPVTPVGKFTVNAGNGYLFVDDVDNQGAENEFTAPVQLPGGAQITAFTVSYWDDSAGTLQVSLWRARQTTGEPLRVASVSTSGESPTWQTGSDATITETAIDNNEFVYWLAASFPTQPQGGSLRLLSVRVGYSFTRPY